MINIGPVLGAAAVLITRAASDEPIVTDRPDFTESTKAVSNGTLQVESGMTYSQTARDDRGWNAPEVLVRYGIGSRAEVRLGLPNYVWQSGGASPKLQGLDDLYLGAKVELGSRKDRIKFAAIPALVIPVGKRGLRSEATAPEGKLVYSTHLAGGLSLSGMMFATFPKVDGKSRAQWEHTLSVGVPVAEGVGMFVEHVFDFASGYSPAHMLHSGFTYQPNSKTQWDVHYAIGLNRSATNYLVGIGYSVRF